MAEHVIQLRDRTCTMKTEKRSRNWHAFGQYDGEKIEVLATAERIALELWKNAALSRLHIAGE